MFQSQRYEYFWIFILIVGFLLVLIFSISKWITPQNKVPEKLTSYESGIEPTGGSRIQFQIRYYMFALVFVIFDVETVFLYPWAMSFYEFGIFSFLEILIFISILIIGLIYAWRKGALEWF